MNIKRLAYETTSADRSSRAESASGRSVKPDQAVADFVCEDDVRRAIREGRTIVVGARSIVTPLARDLGSEHGILIGTS
jgi:hypothetical protein